MSVLAEILARKRSEVRTLRAQARSPATREPLDVVGALARAIGRELGRDLGAPLRLIAEVKLRSPSAGPLSRTLAPAERALVYAEAGAAMVSVLCDETFFDGAWEHVASARARLDEAGRRVPILAKEFVVDERQIEEARDRGADAVLLIARIVERQRLAELAHCARRERLEPFVEVVDEGELEAALEARARVIGVNARDLDTLRMDASRAARVLAAIPPGIVAVHLSGLRNAAEVGLLARAGEGRPDAALVGEALMREEDPRDLLGSMVRAAVP